MSLFFSVNSYGQLVGGASVHANFGVEADAYANLLQFGNLSGPANTDDWFNTAYPGSGTNVIDESTAAALKTAIQADNNYSFELRQKYTTPNIPGVPFPVIISGDGNPYLWIDAVYGRDTNSAQSNSDSSIFTSTSDKNPDNPITWNVGSGSVPQKDDIIDVMAALRGTNPHDPTTNAGYPVDDRPFDTLYVYAAATLRATNGSKHIDFEYFRTLARAEGGVIVNTGPDGGRTAWKFNPDGSVLTPGTIIVSIDYENGGTQPDVRIRLWMDQTDFNNLNPLTMAQLKFTPVAGSFETGEQSGVYGYGRIIDKAGAPTAIWGRVNAEAATLGPPWGTLAGSTATFYDDYQQFQHVEIGINLTAFGLDRRGTTDPCASILGSLLVKTRSCAGGNNDPFTCELKDYAGPYQFGFTVTPEVTLGVDRTITCTDPSATITATGVQPLGAMVKFYGPDPTPGNKDDGIGSEIPADDPAPDLNRVVTVGGVYAAVVEIPGFPGCTATSYVTVEEDKTPPNASDAHTNVSCNGGTDGSVTITFSGGTGPYEVNFNGGGYVSQTSPKTYAGLAAGTYTWIVEGANGCTVSGSETITEPTPLIASDAHTDVTCNGGTDGSVTVTFSGGTAPYMVNFNGAGFVTQISPKAYTGLAAGTYSWVVKDAHGCEQSGSETVTEPTALIASDAHTNVTCNGGTDGSVTVTFSGGTAPYMVNFNGGGFATQTSPKAYTGLAAGTYSWVVKDAHGCEQSGSETVTQPSALVASDAHTDASCNGGTDGSVTITFSGGTAPYMVNFNGSGFVTQTSPKAYTGLATGTYSWVVKDAHGCEQSGSETVGQPSSIVASDAHTDVSCNGGSDGSVTVTFSGGTAPYMVNFNGGGFATQTSPKAYTGLAAGTYSWVVKDAHGCEQSGSETVTQPTALVASDSHVEVTCLGFTDGSITITFSGGTAPYMVNFNGGGFMVQTSPKTYTGLGAGTYTWVVKDDLGCEQSGSETLADGPSCGGQLCTYTQGAYGNSGGKYCDGTTGGIPTIDLIAQAITNAGGSITVGKLGASVVMSLGDENCIITQMPGGGKATEIVPAGDYNMCPSLPNSFLKNGKINNVLLSQTIALSLNVNITSPSQLGSFILQAGTLATAKPEGGCGSSVAKQRICGHFEDNVWVNTVNEYTYRTFSAAVINAIIPDGNNNKTIAGLLDLANRALANVDGVKNSEGGASLSDIAGAVAAVNEVFDECAIAVGWDIEKCPEPPTLDLSSMSTAKISSTEPAGFTAYPVSFQDQLTIRYDFDYVSDVKIEVFNSKGVIVYSMIDTGSYLGKEVTITISNTLQQQQVYYVRLTTNQGSTVKSVMSSY